MYLFYIWLSFWNAVKDYDDDVWCDLLCLHVRLPTLPQICCMNSRACSHFWGSSEMSAGRGTCGDSWGWAGEVQQLHTHTHTHTLLSDSHKPVSEITTTIVLHPLQLFHQHFKMSHHVKSNMCCLSVQGALEFLTTVPELMRTLAPPLQEVTAFLGNRYCWSCREEPDVQNTCSEQ